MNEASDEQEYENAIRRAFVDHGADYISVWSRRQEFQIRGAEFGVRRGWLEREVIGDDQSTEWRYRLTLAGREYFLGSNK